MFLMEAFTSFLSANSVFPDRRWVTMTTKRFPLASFALSRCHRRKGWPILIVVSVVKFVHQVDFQFAVDLEFVVKPSAVAGHLLQGFDLVWYFSVQL